MKIYILAIGKEKDFEGRDLVVDYTSRIQHYYPCEWIYKTGTDKDSEHKIIGEYIEKVRDGAYIIMCDEKGKGFDSSGFAKEIERAVNTGRKSIHFIIGGSYGLNDDLRSKAHAVIQLSMLTFPHQLVRLILAEQIYRAGTILKGEKYHH